LYRPCHIHAPLTSLPPLLIPSSSPPPGLPSFPTRRSSDLQQTERVDVKYSPKALIMALLAIVVAFVVQLWLGSMILGALAGFVLFNISGVVKWKEADDLFTEGMKMLAMIGFIMIAANGFAEVM